MNKKTVRNLMIGTIAFLGASYAVERYMKSKKNKKLETEQQKQETEAFATRNYHQIGKVTIKDGKMKTESIKEMKKVI